MPIPEVFFTVLLPEIEDSAELKVTLHLFWLLAQKQGNPRCVSGSDLQTDSVLMHSLKRKSDPRPPEERLRQGLELALARGTLLRIHLRLVSEGGEQAEVVDWYFFNTPRSRKVVQELQGGQMVPVRLLDVAGEQAGQESETAVPAGTRTYNNGTRTTRTVQVQIERPNIFVLYEQNIGLLTPLIADYLKDAADLYPQEWIEAAFREAVQHNKRNWSYISAILRRWETEGRQQWKA
ncbi:MAG TPA: DnaD domain protein [Ktedonobacteraceae bacterium]|nr:DnaD domain protein [Ktedonobacteraceae bacterium]